ncbi:MAG: FAD-dependent oxidoreductase [candidate division WOR-3 bacterium]
MSSDIRPQVDKPASPEKPVGAVLVVGSGIGGIQASLELADAGFKVYLLDEATAIGGVMAGLDKTFPTNDCSMCILAPKLVSTGRHQNIQLLNYSELVALEGEPGRFRARIRHRPRYVLLDKCTGCMDCTKVCPVHVVDEYNQKLSERRATYKLYPQAIPNAVAIEKNEKRAPCRLACPAGVNAQGYVALIAERKFKEAYDLVRERLPFPGICGRVCHHPCETECNRKEFEGPVAIRTLKRFVADRAMAERSERSARPDKPEERAERVAVVGAGPAGLTCALDLRNKGYKVTVFEAADKPGGMMRYGIPAYRLPREIIDAEIADILDTGVELRTNSPIRTRQELDGLLSDGYKAVFLSLGCQKSRTLKIPGMELEGVHLGVEYLRAASEGRPLPTGKKVVVIGGGNVAVDVAMTARRCGAEDVTMVCLECREEMPAFEYEIEEALAEGIKINPSWGPQAILGREGKVTGLETVECTRVFDDAGRFNPEFNTCNTGFVAADTVILAIGQAVDADGFDGFEKGAGGVFKADKLTLATNVPGVFAGGDMVSGPASVIEAVAAGHEAAISIDRYIRGEDLSAGREKPRYESASAEESAAVRAKILRQERAKEPVIPIDRRQDFVQEIALGFDEETAVAEAKRCLACGVCSECMQCVAACEAKAIDHTMKPTESELEVGAVVLATGFKEYKPTGEFGYGYGRYPNVVTSLEFERILSASGPYEGHVKRPSDGKQPRKIAWIQCVGSRNQEHYYCSSVCCMFATKEAVIAREHCGGNLECHIYFMDMRCFGKDFEKYYERAHQEYGVQFRRCKVSAVERKGSKGGENENLLISYEDENGLLKQEEYDMVVVSSALMPNPRSVELCRKLGVSLDEQGFVRTDPFRPMMTDREGVFACGAMTEPKDIPETVTEATGVAAAVGSMLARSRNTLVSARVYPPQRDVSAEEPRIGVFVCNCGINIGGVVKVGSVVEYARTLPNVVYAEENLFTCSQDTQQKIRKAIEEYRLNRVVVASCTPRTHEPLFQETLAEAGLNPYLFTMANIRDQCSWVHMQQPEEATRKSQELVRMAVANARLLRPLESYPQPITQRGLVIGGGLAGMTAALAIAEQGFEVYLVEREERLGGKLRRMRYNETGEDITDFLARLDKQVRDNPRIKLFTWAELVSVSGYVGNYKTRIKHPGGETELEHGIFLVATGAEEYKPTEYLYGRDARVKTQTELEDMVAGSSDELRNAEYIVMIQCVGSREPDRPWCSRVCCTEAVKNALRIKQLNPKANVYILYRDMRTYGFKEALYRDARASGVMFVRFDPESKPEVTQQDGNLHVSVYDPVLQRRLGINADLLVLSTGVVPPKTNSALAQLLKVPLNEDGFFLEAHMKLRPVDFTTRGVFMAGMCHSPRRIPETVAQAYAAAARACTILSHKELSTEAVVAQVNPRWCVGCGVCEETCQYEAVRVNPETGKSEVTAVLCQGCGACAAACPSEAIKLKGFEAKNVISMVDAALQEV